MPFMEKEPQSFNEKWEGRIDPTVPDLRLPEEGVFPEYTSTDFDNGKQEAALRWMQKADAEKNSNNVRVQEGIETIINDLRTRIEQIYAAGNTLEHPDIMRYLGELRFYSEVLNNKH